MDGQKESPQEAETYGTLQFCCLYGTSTAEVQLLGIIIISYLALNVFFNSVQIRQIGQDVACLKIAHGPS